jgi:hypothetical protein
MPNPKKYYVATFCEIINVGANSIVSIHLGPKPGKVTFFQCGFGVEKWVSMEAITNDN